MDQARRDEGLEMSTTPGKHGKENYQVDSLRTASQSLDRDKSVPLDTSLQHMSTIQPKVAAGTIGNNSPSYMGSIQLSPNVGVDPSESLRRGRSFGPLRQSTSAPETTKTVDSSTKPQQTAQAHAVADIEEPSANIEASIKPSRDAHQRDVTKEHVQLDAEDPQAKGEDMYASNNGKELEVGAERGRTRSSITFDSPSLAPTASRTPSTSKAFVFRQNDDNEKSTSRGRAASPMPPVPWHPKDAGEVQKALRLNVNIYDKELPGSYRVMRTIVRGNYSAFQRESEMGRKRCRTYFQAANLKQEATFATKWAIGRVLRDGDTLMLVFAIDKDPESGFPTDELSQVESGNPTQESTKELEPTTNLAARKRGLSVGRKGLLPNSRQSSIAANARASAKEQERTRALDKLSDLCLHFLRKTALQVKVTIEIIHCKNARYLITEAIAAVQPTLVIVGSRGLVGVKGVRAGSFSRYLIMKSSVPVMTARMKPSKRKTHLPRPALPLANNIAKPRPLKYTDADDLAWPEQQDSNDEEDTSDATEVRPPAQPELERNGNRPVADIAPEASE